jgi:4'-phosphopantetheinyl transferase
VTDLNPFGNTRVDVNVVKSDATEIQARLAAYRSLLSADETQRANRFVQPADAERFVIGRVLVRTMLSRYADIAPRQWPIVVDFRGRPMLGTRLPGTPDLRFNLSHTPGLVACAVTIGREVGIDVENTRRTVLHDVPERFFSPREVRDLRSLPRVDQEIAFFDYWTLKEAYIKARGLGLALPLGQFTFVLRPDRPPAIEFAPELHDDPASWQFAQFWPTSDHRMAVAARRHGGDVQVVVQHVVPEVDRAAD